MPSLHVPDWQRFWFGLGVPPGFSIEVALRILLLYAVMAVAIRLMGRRTSSELTRNELLAIVALAAAIGPSIQAPDRGLLPPMLIAVWVVLWQRGVARATVHSQAFERLMHGQGVAFVKDGVIDLHALESSAVSRERLFAELRSRGFLHLGCVQRVYLEADGAFSNLAQEPPIAGLALMPSFDFALRAELPDDPKYVVCGRCGHLRERHAVEASCKLCGSDAWLQAVRP